MCIQLPQYATVPRKELKNLKSFYRIQAKSQFATVPRKELKIILPYLGKMSQIVTESYFSHQ